MNEHLMRVIIESIMFLHLTPDELLDLDTAIAQTEQIAHLLQNLTSEEKEQFASFTNRLVEQENSFGKASARMDLLRHLPESLGLSSK